MGRYLIVGGGTAGLTSAYWLARAGLPVTVIEKENTLGGLARSFRYGDYFFDIGPHRFFTANPLVMNFLKEIGDNDFLEIPRFSSVYFMSKYHDWPLRLGTVAKLPFSVAFRAGIDLLFKSLFKQNKSQNFKDYVLSRYGKTLYDTFFKEYTEKFIGLDTEHTHRNWAKVGVERATIDETVNTASLGEIFKLMLMPAPVELNFWYPRQGGIQGFWQSCAEAIKKAGGEILTNCQPQSILTDNGRISEVITNKGKISCQKVLWSGSINRLSQLTGVDDSKLDYRAQVIFNVMLKNPPLRSYQWCYYGAKELLFSRLSNPAAFSPQTVPPGRGALCAEVACQEGDDIWQEPEKYSQRVIKELTEVRAISSAEEVADIQMEKISCAYPRYCLDYPQKLEKLEKECRSFSNLHLLGRTGKFWYNNMDHSIENSLEVVAAILAQLPEQSDKVKEVVGKITLSQE